MILAASYPWACVAPLCRQVHHLPQAASLLDERPQEQAVAWAWDVVQVQQVACDSSVQRVWAVAVHVELKRARTRLNADWTAPHACALLQPVEMAHELAQRVALSRDWPPLAQAEPLEESVLHQSSVRTRGALGWRPELSVQRWHAVPVD